MWMQSKFDKFRGKKVQAAQLTKYFFISTKTELSSNRLKLGPFPKIKVIKKICTCTVRQKKKKGHWFFHFSMMCLPCLCIFMEHFRVREVQVVTFWAKWIFSKSLTCKKCDHKGILAMPTLREFKNYVNLFLSDPMGH